MGFWQWVFVCLLAGGAVSTLLGAVRGLGAVTHLSDIFPWGILTGLNVFCGISVATGGLVVAAVIYLMGWESARPILRAALLSALSGYVVAILALLATLGHPQRIAPLAVGLWSPRSILAGVAVSLLLLLAILALEFSAEIAGRLGRPASSWMAWAVVPLTCFAAALALVHQFIPARLILLAGMRFSPLWATPRLPILFLLSAICACLAILVFASWQAREKLGCALPSSLLAGISRALAIALFLYLALRAGDFAERGVLPLLLGFRAENYLLGLELSLFLLPMLLLLDARVMTPRMLYLSAVLIIAGFMTNHMNTAITSLEAASGAVYWPKWTELLLAYSLIACGVALFGLGVQRLHIFPRIATRLPEHDVDATLSTA
jgi:Ni/Fe-hydrogenase subunit HybB-like protein